MKQRLWARPTRFALVLAIVAAVLAPIAVSAVDRFTDVPNSNNFHDDIAWLADTGVTAGCNPPANDRFCPGSSVTREQMAAFMHRLAENKVVKAKTAETAENAATADYATTAGSATTADSATTAGSATTADSATTANTASDSNYLNGWAGSYYENPIDGTACSTCPGGAGVTKVQVLTLTTTATRSGYLQISTTLQANQPGSNDLVQSWVTIDKTDCGGWFFIPTEHVVGSYSAMFLDGNIAQGTISSTVVTPVSVGAHTIRLCALGSDTMSVYQASLTTVFSAAGSSNTITSADATMSPEYVDGLKKILGNVGPIN